MIATQGYGGSISTEVVGRKDLPEEVWREGWRTTSVALSPERIDSAARDARWVAHYALARDGGRLVGVLPLFRPTVERVPDPSYDVRQIAPELAARAGDDARSWIFIGGRRDLAAGTLVLDKAPEAVVPTIRSALVARAFEEADRADAFGVALYVRDEEVRDFETGLAPRAHVVPIAKSAQLPVVGSGEADYLAWLTRSHRSVVRRDRRRLAELGLHANEVRFEDVLEEAAPLIASIKEKHGVPDDPRLIALRMGEWIRDHGERCVGFAVRDEHDRLLAASFAFRQRDILEMYEIGLVDDQDVRQLVYAEVLVYAPLRHAVQHNCRLIRLGLDSIAPKRLRGAEIHSVWAVALRGEAENG